MASPEKDINDILWQHLRLCHLEKVSLESDGWAQIWRLKKRVRRWIGKKSWMGLAFPTEEVECAFCPTSKRCKFWTLRLILSPKYHCLPIILIATATSFFYDLYIITLICRCYGLNVSVLFVFYYGLNVLFYLPLNDTMRSR